jgi:trehalose 6-phosphate phosphatase
VKEKLAVTRTWTPGIPDEALSAIAITPRLVVALDFDGVASPLVADPMAARALPEVAAQVARLAALPDTTVAFVSGRSMHDLRVITDHGDDSPVVLAGSHGAQYWFPGEGDVTSGGEPLQESVRDEIRDAVRPLIDRYEGAEFEPKTYGFGVHTRRADRETEAQVFAEVDALVAEHYPQWRRRSGHRVLEFSSRPEGKDAAMTALRERFDATGILFAGDDVTDEDALRVLLPGDLGVRVGPGDTAATLRVENPQQIAQLLEALADERAAQRE